MNTTGLIESHPKLYLFVIHTKDFGGLLIAISIKVMTNDWKLKVICVFGHKNTPKVSNFWGGVQIEWVFCGFDDQYGYFVSFKDYKPSKYFSASNAAIQPVPADVMAWR